MALHRGIGRAARSDPERSPCDGAGFVGTINRRGGWVSVVLALTFALTLALTSVALIGLVQLQRVAEAGQSRLQPAR